MAKVLALDDEPDVLMVVEAALEMAGHSVVSTTDPVEGVSLAIEHGVDVVVLDVTMPEVSGFEVMESLRAHPQSAGLPVLFLSALGDSQHRIRGLRRGADDYLAKPFEPEELVLRVEKLASLRQRTRSDLHDISRVSQALASEAPAKNLRLGRYQALEIVGTGAMGLVIRGWDPRLKRPVALKTIRSEGLEVSDLESPLENLIAEATALARFNHPNIVTIYDAGFADDSGFLVMEYVDGVSLQQRLDLGFLPLARTVEIGIAVARALEAAHSANLVHRDVKPGNILLGNDGTIKVSDFGVAGLARSLAAPEEHRIFGTPGFVPPESLLGEGQEASGDLFGLGAVLYRGLVGAPAFGGASVRDVLLDTIRREATDPHLENPSIPEGLSRLVVRMLDKRPASRPSAREVEESLGRLAADLPADAAEEARPQRVPEGEGLSAAVIDTRALDIEPWGKS